MAETSMGVALRAAGVVPASERLQEVAERAVAGGSIAGAVLVLQAGVQTDAALLWALVEPHFERIAKDYLAKVARETRSREGTGQCSVDALKERARPIAAPTRRGIEAIAAAAPTIARSLLRSFTVNGQPLAEVTVEEATAWAKSRERDARFVRLLTDGLPPGAKIGEHVTDNDAERAYRLAEEAGNA